MTSPQFLYVFTPGRRPDLAVDPEAWTDDDKAVAAQHFAYLKRGAEAGTVLLAGRSQDWKGPAIVILAAADMAAAHRFMDGDPFVSSGLFGANLHPFQIALGKE